MTGAGDLGSPLELAKERLRSDDCGLALAAYQQRLALPPLAGVVVSKSTNEALPPQEQDRRAAEFALRCQSLVGQARRAVLRCWLDAADATAFVACNDRF